AHDLLRFSADVSFYLPDWHQAAEEQVWQIAQKSVLLEVNPIRVAAELVSAVPMAIVTAPGGDTRSPPTR
ncbi:MAG: hypothetical protein AB1744_12440, partial [Candidatus Zixiibacteriota bacterium]